MFLIIFRWRGRTVLWGTEYRAESFIKIRQLQVSYTLVREWCQYRTLLWCSGTATILRVFAGFPQCSAIRYFFLSFFAWFLPLPREGIPCGVVKKWMQKK